MSPTWFRACIEKLFSPAFDCFPSVSRLLCQLSSCFRPLLKINFAELKIISIFAVQYRGVEQLVARRAHNPEVGGSSPPPATKTKRPFRPLFFVLPSLYCCPNYKSGRSRSDTIVVDMIVRSWLLRTWLLGHGCSVMAVATESHHITISPYHHITRPPSSRFSGSSPA